MAISNTSSEAEPSRKQPEAERYEKEVAATADAVSYVRNYGETIAGLGNTRKKSTETYTKPVYT